MLNNDDDDDYLYKPTKQRNKFGLSEQRV